MLQSSVHVARGSVSRPWFAAAAVALGLVGSLCGGCKDSGKVSAEAAVGHVSKLVERSAGDVEEVRKGLPEGAKQLVALWAVGTSPGGDAGEGAEPAAPAAAGSAALAPSASPPAPGPGSAAPPAPSASAAPATQPAAAPPAPVPSGEAPPAASASAAPPGSAEAAGSAAAAAGSAAAPSASEAPPSVRPPSGSGQPDPSAVRSALAKARDKVQDLRVAKSTFFALADTQGIVLRNDQDQDLMVGKGLFSSFPELRKVLTGTYVETLGSMPEMAGIGNRADGQWVAAAPVLQAGQVRGLYVTGWSWSAYAKRLENALRGDVREGLPAGKNEPLVYVVVLVGKEAYAWEAPDVNVRAVAKLDFPGQLKGNEPGSQIIELTGRRWGVAAQRAPILGDAVILAVLRSET